MPVRVQGPHAPASCCPHPLTLCCPQNGATPGEMGFRQHLYPTSHTLRAASPFPAQLASEWQWEVGGCQDPWPHRSCPCPGQSLGLALGTGSADRAQVTRQKRRHGQGCPRPKMNRLLPDP